MGPTVWDDDGPMPMRMRSKTLNGRDAHRAVTSPAIRAAGVAESRAAEMSVVSPSSAADTAEIPEIPDDVGGSADRPRAVPTGPASARSRMVMTP